MSLNHVGRAGALILSCAALLAAAAPASAATPSVTGDGGAPVPLQNGMTLRHMAPEVSLAFTAQEQYYAIRVVGPTGPAAIGADCLRTSSFSAERVRYQGNGAYTVFFKTADTSEACRSAAEQSAAFTINASTAVVPPDHQPLFRRVARSFVATTFEVPVEANPGADSYEMRYAMNATLGADGGIAGTSDSAFVDTATGKARVSFLKPGRYTFVVRAKSFRSDVPTAWSPRVDITVVAPFDLSLVTFPDSRGPTYKLVGQLREPGARGGKVKVSIKHAKDKRFKRLGTAKVGKGGKFKLRFRYRRYGKVQLRFSYGGSATIAKGVETRKGYRISRRFF